MAIPGVQITATNKSPLILIATWLLLVLAAFAYIMRSIVKISRQAMRFELDDYLLTGALVFCAAQSLATILRAANGFGKPFNALSPDKVNKTMEAAMAANILYVMSLALSKLSLLLLLAKLSPNQRHKRVMHGISLFVALFTFISLFVVSFSCSAPNTWNFVSGRCINRVGQPGK
jgi:surface polysaccharide O-acyltransferase-like enzyme